MERCRSIADNVLMLGEEVQMFKIKKKMNLLKNYITQKGITQKELSKRCGGKPSEATISNAVRSKSSVLLLLKIAEKLNEPINVSGTEGKLNVKIVV